MFIIWGNKLMTKGVKENPLGLQSLKHFLLRSKENSFTKTFSLNSLKENFVYKVTKGFPLASKAVSHTSVFHCVVKFLAKFLSIKFVGFSMSKHE